MTNHTINKLSAASGCSGSDDSNASEAHTWHTTHGNRQAVPVRAIHAAFLATMAVAAAVTESPAVLANDVNVPPSMCVAPFLSQAFPMRWHEHYLMNPTSGTRTWVICPLTYDNDVVDFGLFDVNARVTGGISPGASPTDTPVCFFTVADRTNLSQPPYINGPKRVYQTGLTTSTNSPGTQLWQATMPAVPIASIQAAIGTGSVNDWSTTVFCRLPPGYGITQVVSINPG